MTDDIIRQLHKERAELIERLSQANRLLGRTLGHLEADLVIEAISNHPASATKRELIEELKAFIKGGLFGDKGKSNG